MESKFLSVGIQYAFLKGMRRFSRQCTLHFVLLASIALCIAVSPAAVMAHRSYSDWLVEEINKAENSWILCLTQRKGYVEHISALRRGLGDLKIRVLPVYEKARQRIAEAERRTLFPQKHEETPQKHEEAEINTIDKELQFNPIILSSTVDSDEPSKIESYRQLQDAVELIPKAADHLREMERMVRELDREANALSFRFSNFKYRLNRARAGTTIDGDWTFVKPTDSSIIRIYWSPEYSKYFGRLIRVSENLRYEGTPEKHVIWRDIRPRRMYPENMISGSANSSHIDDYELSEKSYEMGQLKTYSSSIRLSDDGEILWYQSDDQSATLQRVKQK
jgi:hypothetical protein